MQTRITCIVFPIIYFILIGFSARADQKIHSFGVADSFALTRLYGTDGVISKENNNPFYFSPDNRRVFLVTGAGDARDKTYIFRLMMFNTSDLVDYLYNDNSYVPSPTVLAEIKYDQRSSSHLASLIAPE